MKKNGFTLVELTISIALLSVVMIFLLNFLTLVKKEDVGIEETTNMEIDKSVISKTINSDILKENYINTFSCTEVLCDITLKSGAKRSITIDGNVVKYTDTINNKVLLSRKTSLPYTLKSTSLTTIDKITFVTKNFEYNIEIISSGSSIKICLVAEGTADIYPRFAPTMEWDTAAGHAIAKAAGKELYHQDGCTPLAYNKEDLLNPWFIVK